MPEFAYEALTESGAVTRGAMPATNEAELEERLRSQGAYLIRARETKPSRRQARGTDARLDRRELIGLTEYLAASVQAGIPILATLDDVSKRLQGRAARRIVQDVRQAMAGEAWLEWRTRPEGSVTYLDQVARFRPRGLAGRLYWYALWPVHQFVFGGMLRGIARRGINYWESADRTDRRRRVGSRTRPVAWCAAVSTLLFEA